MTTRIFFKSIAGAIVASAIDLGFALEVPKASAQQGILDMLYERLWKDRWPDDDRRYEILHEYPDGWVVQPCLMPRDQSKSKPNSKP